MAEYKHGEMNIDVQEHTFHGFIRAATTVAGVAVFVLLFLAVFNS